MYLFSYMINKNIMIIFKSMYLLEFFVEYLVFLLVKSSCPLLKVVNLNLILNHNLTSPSPSQSQHLS